MADNRKRVDTAKVALGERGDVWWADGDPDLNRKLVNDALWTLVRRSEDRLKEDAIAPLSPISHWPDPGAEDKCRHLC